MPIVTIEHGGHLQAAIDLHVDPISENFIWGLTAETKKSFFKQTSGNIVGMLHRTEVGCMVGKRGLLINYQ